MSKMYTYIIKRKSNFMSQWRVNAGTTDPVDKAGTRYIILSG